MTSSSLSCIIIDDDEIDRLTTQAYVKKYPFLNITGVFSSATESLAAAADSQVDVLFTDIDMPDLNGLQFRAKMMHIPVCIFISAYPDYAVESFEMEAFDFMVKPFKHERFDHCMTRVQHYFELKRKAQLFDYSLGNNDTVFIKDGHQQIKLNLHEVIYLEALKDYTRIVTTTKKYSVLASIGNLLMEAAFQSFVRIHRSYAVQRHYIERISAQEVFLRNLSLPIGRSYKDVLANLK